MFVACPRLRTFIINKRNVLSTGISVRSISNNSGEAISSKCRLISVKGERGLKSIRHKTARANTGLKRGGYSEGGKATWIPEGGINPPSLSPMLTHLDNGDEAIIFSAPEARYVSMRIRLSDLMWIPIVSDLLSTLLSRRDIYIYSVCGDLPAICLRFKKIGSIGRLSIGPSWCFHQINPLIAILHIEYNVNV